MKRAAGKVFNAPKVTIDPMMPLRRFGSTYGGWTLRADKALQGATVVTAGLGEDASFDVEFAKAFGARAVIVDPTPRSVLHYQGLVARAGQAPTKAYETGGNQPLESYPLDGVAPSQLVLEAKALWIEPTTLKFFLPTNPEHVSHSITNFQNNYSSDGPAIEVQSTTLPAILETYGIEKLQLLKLDIEGAEIAVLSDMLERGIRPVQLLIEFDELMLRTRRALARWAEMDRQLRAAGYGCGFFDKRSCFLYALPE